MFYQNISEYFMSSVKRFPNKTALIFLEERLTYSEANKRINRIANGLLSLGVKSGDKIAFMFPNCSEIILLFYAIQKIGAIAVPLNFRLIPREIKFLIENSDSEYLIFASEFADRVIDAQLSEELFIICCGEDGRFENKLSALEKSASDEEPVMFCDSEAISRIQFTGGSTGVPKGVMRTHSQDIYEICSEVMYSRLGATENPVVLIQCPLEHHGGHSWFNAALAIGATLIICSTYDSKTILECIEREHVTHTLLLPPTTYRRLCEYPEIDKYNLKSVIVAQSAAGGTNVRLIRKMNEVFPNADIYYGWGQTESGVGTFTILNNWVDREEDAVCTIGKPMPFMEMKVVDNDWNELPPNEIGEAAVRSPACMKGYYGHPELTEALMGPNGWMRTGDMMYRDENGYFYMIARRRNVVKSGGENIFCDDVESTIKLLDKVMECVIVGVPDQRLGEAILAVVQLKEGETLTLEELQTHCRKYMASYKKPLYLEITNSIDMDDAGKIRRSTIRDKYYEKYKIN